MGLIKKMNENLRNNNLAKFYAEDVLQDYESMKIKTDVLREIMDRISKARRKDQFKERESLVLRLYKVLDYIDMGHATYISDYADLRYLIKSKPDIRLMPGIRKKISTALNSKNLLRQDFETIYRNFKSMAKSFEDIPMKDILKHMRDCFNFNTDNENKTNNKPMRYYDSITMTMRILY